MSETWTSLLAALVGAIVGGLASLGGTMLVNKQQMATNARMRLYDELLPELADAVDGVIEPLVPEDQVAGEVLPERLEKVRRASAIASRHERRFANNLWQLWGEHQAGRQAEIEAWTPRIPKSVNADPDPPPGTEPPLTPAQRRLRRIREEIEAFSDHLATKLG
jgi:hypothetical protein